MLTQLTISDGMAFFECNSIPGCKPDDDLLETSRYDTECTFASSLPTTKMLTGKALRPIAVWFRHWRPADLSECNRIFQCDVKFSMLVDRLIFDANCLEWSVLSSNANLLSFFEEQAEAILDQLNGDDRYTAKVTLAVVQRLKGELPTVNAIASDLAMSTRQLQRALKVEGTSFQKVLDQIRQDIAIQYLKDPTIPIHSIAFLLGFLEPSAFNRWTGKPPRSSAQGSPRTIERLESHHRFHNSLDDSMVLLNDVIQILALPQLGSLVDRLILFESLHSDGISRIFIDGNHPWNLSVLTLQTLTKESCGCLAIPLCTEQKI